jgi:endonuclease/exonuclease/phosphatase family metal-dependent hydrolase
MVDCSHPAGRVTVGVSRAEAGTPMGTLNFAWWNLQNLFDTDDDAISRDFEYTPAHGWTDAALAAKLANLAAALDALHGGQPLDLLAVCEIEKESLLARLLRTTARQRHLTVANDPMGTSDLRGIDVALAFNEAALELRAIRSHVVHLRYRTRDILEAEFLVRASGEPLVVIASHWPSRSQGRWESEPARITVAENIAYLIEGQLKFDAVRYEALRAANDLPMLQSRWDTPLLVCGDFNDEPADRSVVEHLKASRERERVAGDTNDLDRFAPEVADYRARDIFVFNATARLGAQGTGSYFFEGGDSGRATNRHQALDQLVVSRGLLKPTGLRLIEDSVHYMSDATVATRSGRPRPFDRKTGKGTSDHLPLLAQLAF